MYGMERLMTNIKLKRTLCKSGRKRFCEIGHWVYTQTLFSFLKVLFINNS